MQINVGLHLSSSKPQYVQQFTWKPKKPLVTRRNNVGANEKMLDTFTTRMAMTSQRDDVLPESETISRMLHDIIYSKAYCNS